MKRMLSILLALCMLLSMIPVVAAADNEISGSDVSWSFDAETGKLTIEGTGPMPEFKSTNAVPWHSHKSAIKTVEIAEGVTTIGRYAFNSHSALTEIRIPESVTYIGERSFYGCSGLLALAIGNGVTEFGELAFGYCDKLTTVTLGSGITEIVKDTFKNCNAIAQVFYMGTEDEWENVDIENNNGGLYDLPESKLFFMKPLPSGTYMATAWTFDPMTFTLTVSGEGDMEDFDDGEQDWFDYRKAIHTVVIESGISAVGKVSFRDHQNIHTVYIPASVTAIGDNAFALCKGLKDVYYGSSQEDWASIDLGTGYNYLTAAKLHYAGDCAHTNVTEKVITNDDQTHTIQVVCACGTIVSETEPEACTDETGDGKCEICGGDVELTCDGENHPKTEVKYFPNDKETDVVYSHSVVSCCVVCEAEVGEPFVEACYDGTDDDSLCDLCKVGTPCSHEDYEAATDTVCNENNTHSIKKTCGNCAMVFDTETVACTDADKDLVCDVCEGEMNGVYHKLDNGVLTIYGKGAMEDYSSFTGMDWSADRDTITEIIIEEGVTHIGARSFYRCILATKVTIAASVESIGDSAFYRCDSLKTVSFGGDKAQWEALMAKTGTNNEKLTAAAVEWVCSHPETTTVNTPNDDGKTHTVTTTCADCGKVETEIVDCTASEPSYTKGENDKHTATVKCTVCEQTLSTTEEDCTFATAYTDNGDRTHAVTKTCTKCAAATTVPVEKCVDEDGDDACDLCQANVDCAHDKQFTHGYLGNGDHATHVPFMFCTVCGEPVYAVGQDADCSDSDKNDVCDLCGQDISCLHKEAYEKTRYEANADRTHKVIVYQVCEMEGCDGIGLTETVKEAAEACVDANSDRLCDKCEYNLTCAHVEVTRTVTYLKDYTHEVKFVCKNCKGVTFSQIDKCVDLAPVDKKCDVCEGVCAHSYTYSYNKIEGKESHLATDTCDWCGEPSEFTEACVDVTFKGTRHDGLCDKCGGAVVCKHTQKTAYTAIEGEETHTVIKTCADCTELDAGCEVCAAFVDTYTEACADTKTHLVCDDCGDAVACKLDDVTYVPDGKGNHTAECKICDNAGEAVSCEDTDADLYCDACDYDLAEIRIVGKEAYETLDKAVAAAVAGDEIVVRVKAVVEGTNIWNLEGVTLTTAAVEDNYSIVLKGSLTINGGTFNLGGVYGIGVTGSLTVKGGTFNVIENNDYLIGNWGTTTINGGEFNGVYCAVNNFAGTTTITGGTFTTEETDYSGEYEAADILANSGLTVSGGTFSKPVDEAYCAEGYVPVDNGDGTYGVGQPGAEIEKFSIAGSNMTLGNELEVNFMVTKKDLPEGDYTAYITQYKADGTTVVTELTEDKWTDLSNVYHVMSARIAAKEMSDQLAIEIKDADGYVYNDAYSTSVRDYGGRALTNPNTTDLVKVVMVDMLNYGASAQQQFTYDTENLANNALTEAQQALATAKVECADDQVKGKNCYGASLSLEDRIEMNVFFSGLKNKDVASMYALVTFEDYNGKAHEARVEGSEFIKMTTDLYGVVVDDIVLADAKQMVTITVYNADGSEYGSATDSVESYVARAEAQNADTYGLYANIMKFAVSAYNYLKK